MIYPSVNELQNVVNICEKELKKVRGRGGEGKGREG